jgi:hypothetical protein
MLAPEGLTVRLVSFVFTGVVCTWSLCGQASATDLGDLAASMQAGDWERLSTDHPAGFLHTCGTSSSSCSILNFSDKTTWDPITRQLYFLGGSHAGPTKFVTYSDDTNAWSELTQPDSYFDDYFVYVYKHAPSQPDTLAPAPPENLTAG